MAMSASPLASSRQAVLVAAAANNMYFGKAEKTGQSLFFSYQDERSRTRTYMCQTKVVMLVIILGAMQNPV